MKINVKCSCGHEVEVEVFGSAAERENKIKWYENHVCSECYKAQQTADNDLPALTGTEKQISWAESIRAKRLDEVKALYAKTAERNSKVLAAHPERAADAKKAQDDLDKFYAQVMAWMSTKCDAGFWIDTRDEINFIRAHAAEINK